VPVVARSDESRSRAHEGGASQVVGSIAELPELDGVVVSTPTTTHRVVVEELLPRGVPIYVEKPLTDDPVSARQLAAAAPDSVFVMHKWRYHDGIRALADIARSQELGLVSGLRTTRVGWGNPHGDVDGVWMLAPHDLSIVLEIFGSIPEPRCAVAERSAGLVTGLVGVLGTDPWAVVEVSIAHALRRREVRLVCRDGVALLPDAYSDHLLVTRGELQLNVTRTEEHRPISTGMPLERELRAFVDHLRGGPPPLSSAADGAAEVAAIGRLRELAGIG
jgi:predicted dehydrogenase